MSCERWVATQAYGAKVRLVHEAQSPLDLIDFPEYGGEGYIYLLNRTEWDRVPVVLHLHGPLVMFAHTMGWPELDEGRVKKIKAVLREQVVATLKSVAVPKR